MAVAVNRGDESTFIVHIVGRKKMLALRRECHFLRLSPMASWDAGAVARSVVIRRHLSSLTTFSQKSAALIALVNTNLRQTMPARWATRYDMPQAILNRILRSRYAHCRLRLFSLAISVLKCLLIFSSRITQQVD